MNQWLFVLILASCFSATAQQSTFMIGADWHGGNTRGAVRVSVV